MIKTCVTETSQFSKIQLISFNKVQHLPPQGPKVAAEVFPKLVSIYQPARKDFDLRCQKGKDILCGTGVPNASYKVS